MSPAERSTPDLGALLRNQAALDQIGADILNGGPRAIRYRETRAARMSMAFVAHHDEVVSVLTEESHFSVCHYDPLYAAVARPGAFLIMRPEGPERAERLAILDAAEAKTPWFGPDSAQRRAMARACVDDVLAAVSRRRRFDLIGEFGFFVPYLIAGRVLGLAGLRSFDLLSLGVCLVNRHSLLQLFRPETGPYLTDLAWSEFVIAQLLINFENRLPPFRWAAAWGAKRVRAQIEHRIDTSPGFEGDHTLLSALWAVRGRFSEVEDDVYREHVVSILMELGATLLLVPGSGFSGIVGRWLGPGGPGLEASLGQLQAMDAEEKAEAFVQEELRLAPPSAHLLRNATGPIDLGGLTLKTGEYVCALVKSAGVDIKNDSREVKADRCPSTYLHFGPENGPHLCRGHRLSPSILAEMFLGLTRLPDLAPRGRLTACGGLVPGRLIVDFGEPVGTGP
jgi:cytochrome P450